MNKTDTQHIEIATLIPFRDKVLTEGKRLYRDLAWRHIDDAYGVWVSEVMLQQTQVVRVDGRWQRWMMRFPTLESLAFAPAFEVLEEWQGMGYNRRALALQKAAQHMLEDHGCVPQEVEKLVKYSGIGPATAAGIRAFAYNLPSMYLETNVRTVFLHEVFPDAEDVPDKVLIPYIEVTCPGFVQDFADDPRTWYYALLDYGAYLKKTLPNPSRRSKTYSKQSKFEGSHRQKRAFIVRLLLEDASFGGAGLSQEEIAVSLNEFEFSKKREAVSDTQISQLLYELCSEGFIVCEGQKYFVKK